METPALQTPTLAGVMQAWSSQNAGVPRRQMEFSVRFQVQAIRSREAAETWQIDHPGVVICTVEEAHRVAQISIDLMSAVDPMG